MIKKDTRGNGHFYRCGLITFPFWFNMGKAAPAPGSGADRQSQGRQKMRHGHRYMKAEHMQLLDVWRHNGGAKRNGSIRQPEGKEFNMSLSNTCLDCHSNKASSATVATTMHP
jgi:hypothetical protein